MAYRLNGSSDPIRFASHRSTATRRLDHLAGYLKSARQLRARQHSSASLDASNAQQGTGGSNRQPPASSARRQQQPTSRAPHPRRLVPARRHLVSPGVAASASTRHQLVTRNGRPRRSRSTPAQTGFAVRKPRPSSRRHRLRSASKKPTQRRAPSKRSAARQLPGVAQLQLRLADRLRRQPQSAGVLRTKRHRAPRRHRRSRHNRRQRSGRLGVNRRRHPRRQLHRHPAQRRHAAQRRVHRHIHQHPHVVGVDVRRRRHQHQPKPQPQLHHPRHLQRPADSHQRGRLRRRQNRYVTVAEADRLRRRRRDHIG